VSRGSLVKGLFLALALISQAGVSAKAQDWSDYLHWPYVPPQDANSGFEYKPLYDNYYTYPREQRIVPQIQGPFYRNFYGGQRVAGHRRNAQSIHAPGMRKFYEGHHYILDVF